MLCYITGQVSFLFFFFFLVFSSHLLYSLGFPCGSAGKESACHVGDLGLIPGLGRSPGDPWVRSLGWEDPLDKEGIGYPLQYPGSADKEFACNVGDLGSISGLGRFPGGGKGYHSSILAWRIPWTVLVHGAAESYRTERLSLHFTSKGYGRAPPVTQQ